MDWQSLITEIGGGLPAVVIVALGVAYWRAVTRIFAMQERMLDREREFSADLRATIEAVAAVQQALERRQ